MIFDSVQNAEIYSQISPNLKVALEFMQNNDLAQMEEGHHPLADGNVDIIIKKGYSTKAEEQCKWENHLEFIDIQYLLSGREKIAYCNTTQMQVKTAYDPKTDKILYHNTDKGFYTKLGAGDFIILFPNDAHMTLISDGDASVNSKAVIKVKL